MASLRQAKALLFLVAAPLASTALVSLRPHSRDLSNLAQRRSGSTNSNRVTQRQRTALPATAMDALPPLVSSDGEPSNDSGDEMVQESFSGKRVALYFAAGWCPMCTRFEPSLLQFQQACADSGKPLELIYVPSDRDADAALQRASALRMQWSVPFGDATAELKQKHKIWAGSESIQFGVFGRRSGVPALVVLHGTSGEELAFLPAEAQGVKALQAWPLDDAQGVW